MNNPVFRAKHSSVNKPAALNAQSKRIDDIEERLEQLIIAITSGEGGARRQVMKRRQEGKL